MFLKQKLFLTIFSFFILIGFTVIQPSSAQAQSCESSLGYTFDYNIKSATRVIIGVPININYTVTDTQNKNVPNLQLNLECPEQNYFVKHDNNFYGHEQINIGLVFNNEVANGNTDFTFGLLMDPDDVQRFAGRENANCSIRLIQYGNVLCEFNNIIPYPKPDLDGFVYSPVGPNEDIPVSGLTNFFGGDICIYDEREGGYLGGCGSPNKNGEFSFPAEKISRVGCDHFLEFFLGKADWTMNRDRKHNRLDTEPVCIFDDDKETPLCGVVGTPCCTYYVQAYGCTEGTPSSQTADCVCIKSGSHLNDGDDQLIPTDICKFAGDKEPECRNCIEGDLLEGGQQGIPTPFGCISAQPQGFVQSLLKVAIGVAGGIAFLMILYGGFVIMMSAGNPEKLNSGKEIITSAISGLLLIVFSAVILRIIGIDILGGFPGFGG